MIILQETTRWPDGQGGNHIYIFKGKPGERSASALAYVPQGSNRVFKFKTPLVLDLKGRTFKPVD
jgi:hypothetical protein